jgi:aspartyl-tRNA(Asn)/glutamyl-tRNA(Gln) amidotransferase subunit A
LAPEDNLPVGFQIMAPAMQDQRMYSVGAALEAELLLQWGAPLLSRIPVLGGAK